MRLILVSIICLICVSVHAQSLRSEIEVHTIYMPKFKVQEASDRNVRAIGLRWMASDFDRVPVELGLNLLIGYERVASGSFGGSLAYVLGEPNALNFKLGMSFSRIDLKDVNVDQKDLAPNVGDVNFTSQGNQIKPYIEWEWNFTKFSSLFIQTGYRIINGEKSVVTKVEPVNDPAIKRRVTERKDSFFYSAAGVEFGFGISIIF